MSNYSRVNDPEVAAAAVLAKWVQVNLKSELLALMDSVEYRLQEGSRIPNTLEGTFKGLYLTDDAQQIGIEESTLEADTCHILRAIGFVVARLHELSPSKQWIHCGYTIAHLKQAN